MTTVMQTTARIETIKPNLLYEFCGFCAGIMNDDNSQLEIFLSSIPKYFNIEK